MKLVKFSVIAAIVVGGLVACSNLAMAQDAGTNAPGGHKGKGGFSVEQRLERIDKEVKLTDAQKPKVKAVLEETSKKMVALRDVPQDERRSKGHEIMDEQNKKMKEILTADQYKKYEEANARMRGKKKGDSAPNETK